MNSIYQPKKDDFEAQLFNIRSAIHAFLYANNDVDMRSVTSYPDFTKIDLYFYDKNKKYNPLLATSEIQFDKKNVKFIPVTKPGIEKEYISEYINTNETINQKIQAFIDAKPMGKIEEIRLLRTVLYDAPRSREIFINQLKSLLDINIAIVHNEIFQGVKRQVNLLFRRRREVEIMHGGMERIAR